jgi:hypothetical protein
MAQMCTVRGAQRPDWCLAANCSVATAPVSGDREAISALGRMRIDRDHLPGHGVGSGSERAAEADDQGQRVGSRRLADRNLGARGTHDMDMGKGRDQTLSERDTNFPHRTAHRGSHTWNGMIEERMGKGGRGGERGGRCPIVGIG